MDMLLLLHTCEHFSQHSSRLLLLEVLHKNIMSLRLLTPIPHHHTRTSHNLSGVAFLVDLAQACPLTELLVVVHLDEVDAVFRTQGFDQFHIILENCHR